MGEADSLISEELAKGIQTVISDEFNVEIWQHKATILRQQGELLQSSAKKLAGAQRVVHNAARNTQKTFQLKQIKAELQDTFNRLLDPLENITADHSSIEDDELEALAQKLLSSKENADVNKLKKSLLSYLNKYREAINLVEKEAQSIGDQNINSFNIQLLKFMKAGYTFLAHLGEEIRQTPILYEVTMNFGGFHKTGIFTLSELMKHTRIEMHRGTYMLRFAGATGLEMSAWSEELEDQYKHFSTNKVISENHWNEGELIEAFQEATTYIINEQLERAIGATPEKIISLDDHGRHYLIHTKLDLSYTKGPDFFASVDKLIDQLFDGDVEDSRAEILYQNSIRRGNLDYVAIQAKAQGATFTNLNGLVRGLIDAHDSLTQLKEVKEQAKTKTQVSGADAAIKKAAEELVAQFLPG